MSSYNRRSALSLMALAALSGCGFKPLYASVGGDLIGRIELGDVDGRSDYYLRQVLRRRLGEGGADSLYRLNVSTDVKTESLILREDDATTRFNYRATASVTVIKLDTAEVVLTDEVHVSSSYDATSSLYASRTSERAVERQVAETLGERISSRVIAELSKPNAT
jgi:LPS-assembly lipoprotein